MDLESRIGGEHNEFRKMIVHLKSTGIEDIDVRREGYPDLMMRLRAHHEAEEKTIIGAAMTEDSLRLLAMELVEEHRIIRVLMVELRNINLDDELWLPKLAVLGNIMEMHFWKEEKQFIPALNQVLAGEQMGKMDENFTTSEQVALRQMRAV